MKIPLSKPVLDAKDYEAMRVVFESGWVMQGPKVHVFEKSISNYLSMPYVSVVNSGTAALHLSLMALGITSGDEVIVPSLSFVATANCVEYVGATPIFAEVDQRTFNIDPHDIKKRISSKTKAIIIVHQFGLAANMDEIVAICKKHKIFLIEDTACGIGSTYNNKLAGTYGDVNCFSFHPRKIITTGEGGAVVTASKNIYDKVNLLRSHGIKKDHDTENLVVLGYNYRLTDIQAALGISQMKKLKSILKQRKILAKRYDNALINNSHISIPFVPKQCDHTYQSYMITIDDAKFSVDQIIELLHKKGIMAKKGIEPIHLQPYYIHKYGRVKLPETELIAGKTLILPIYNQMTKFEQDYIISSLLNILK